MDVPQPPSFLRRSYAVEASRSVPAAGEPSVSLSCNDIFLKESSLALIG